MKKKIDLFWYWFIFVVAFVLCFFAINNKRVNAYFLNSDGNIQSDNLIPNDRGQFECYKTTNTTCVLNEGVSITSDFDISLSGVTAYTYITKDLSQYINEVGVYRVTVFTKNNSVPNRICIFGNSSSQSIGCTYDSTSHVFTINENNINNIKRIVIYNNSSDMPNSSSITINNFMITKGKSIYENYIPGGTWYSEKYVGDLATGVISYSSASLTYDNRDYGTSHSISDVSSYIDSSFGYIYFDRLWRYLDTLTSSEYENAWLTLQLNNKMNLNTTYILNSMFNNGNYGVGAKFYQGDNLILNVTNWYNNDYAYCNETSGATCSVQISNFVNVGDRPDLQNSFTYFDKIEIWSADTDKRTGSFGFQNISYNQGYNSGYNLGYSTGSSNGEKTGYNKGYNNGYLYGYEKGVDAVEGTDNTLVGLVGGILTAPVNMLKTIFDFEFLGINLTHFIFSIVSLFIVIWLIKIFL